MRNSGFIWVIVTILALLDLYIFQVVKMLTHSSVPRVRSAIFIIYWVVSVSSLLLMVLLPYLNYDNWPKSLRSYLFAILIGLFFAKLITSIFFLIDDLRRGVMWIIGKLFSNPSVDISEEPEGITRSAFLSWFGIAAGATLFGSLVYGFSNKYRYQTKRVSLAFDNLPQALRG